MKTFTEFTDTPSRNLHLDHLDEAHFIAGEDGAILAMESIQSIIDNSPNIFITEKWDGAPSIFAGTDPVDGAFFVATKSVFNKTPKLYKETFDIISNEPASKAKKLVEAFKWLQHLNIPKDTVLQGDLLWTSGDHKYRMYENTKYVTVHPNTLVYAWEDGTDEAQAVRNAELGIVFHTTYRGQNDLQNYQSTFGANVSNLRQIPEVWVRDAAYDLPQITESTKQAVSQLLDEMQDIVCDYNAVTSVMESVPQSASGAKVTTYFNSQIRGGYYPPADAFDDYVRYVQEYYNSKVIEAVKTDKAKDSKKAQLKQLLDDMRLKEKHFHNAFYYTTKINEAKLKILEDINATRTTINFYESITGDLIPSNPEGYVVVDKLSGNGLKLVNREIFSYLNFSEAAVKGWQK